jgi:hypothetical protein
LSLIGIVPTTIVSPARTTVTLPMSAVRGHGAAVAAVAVTSRSATTSDLDRIKRGLTLLAIPMAAQLVAPAAMCPGAPSLAKLSSCATWMLTATTRPSVPGGC